MVKMIFPLPFKILLTAPINHFFKSNISTLVK
jgi:hypothetical protein